MSKPVCIVWMNEARVYEQALARTTPTDVKPGRYRPTDQLLAFLERL